MPTAQRLPQSSVYEKRNTAREGFSVYQLHPLEYLSEFVGALRRCHEDSESEFKLKNQIEAVISGCWD